MHHHRVVSQPFEENSYIAYADDSNDCIVVDPGLEPELILKKLDQLGRTPVALLITHGHSDHIAGNAALKDRWPDCPLVIGYRDADKLTDPQKNLSAPFGLPLTSPPADLTVRQGDQLQYAGLRLEVREIPGHSVGHVVFVALDERPIVVFGGDVLFQGSIGRTDFPDGSFERLRDAIHQQLFTLPDDTLVLPGHGPRTTVGQEKRHNPYVALSQ